MKLKFTIEITSHKRITCIKPYLSPFEITRSLKPKAAPSEFFPVVLRAVFQRGHEVAWCYTASLDDGSRTEAERQNCVQIILEDASLQNDEFSHHLKIS